MPMYTHAAKTWAGGNRPGWNEGGAHPPPPGTTPHRNGMGKQQAANPSNPSRSMCTSYIPAAGNPPPPSQACWCSRRPPPTNNTNQLLRRLPPSKPNTLAVCDRETATFIPSLGGAAPQACRGSSSPASGRTTRLHRSAYTKQSRASTAPVTGSTGATQRTGAGFGAPDSSKPPPGVSMVPARLTPFWTTTPSFFDRREGGGSGEENDGEGGWVLFRHLSWCPLLYETDGFELLVQIRGRGWGEGGGEGSSRREPQLAYRRCFVFYRNHQNIHT